MSEEVEARTLVATFGFDIDFVVRRITARRYSQVRLLSLKTREGEERVAKAFHALKAICISMRIDCTLEGLEASGIIRAVYTILKNASQKGPVDLYLTGGPRILVVSALVAALMLGEDESSRIQVAVEGEAFEHSWEPKLSLLKQLLSMDDRDRDIVLSLRTLGRASLAELARQAGIPKSTVFKRLRRLMANGIVCGEGDVYLLCKEVYDLL